MRYEACVFGFTHASCPMPRASLLPERNPLQLLQRNSQHRPEREPLRETVRDAQAGSDELQEIERRLAARAYVRELPRQVLAVVCVEMKGLQVIAEMHLAQR